MCSSSYHLAALGFYRERVAEDLSKLKASNQPDDYTDPNAQPGSARAVFPDIHIASSCLQKALRRGALKVATAAARYLLRHDPDRLWRRLTVCAFEDFGLCDLSVTARVTVVSASKAFRTVHGEERVLVHLLELLCALPKDRRLDDLYALGAAGSNRSHSLKPQEPGALAAVIAPLVHQTSRLIATCERPVPRRSFRSLSPEACERALRQMARDGLFEDGLFELCAVGVKVSRCLLPLLLPLAIEATEACGGLGDSIDQVLAPVPLIGGVPAYAFDGFTRSGRAVLAELGRREPRLARTVAHLPSASRLDVLHHLLFFAEGGLSTPLRRDHLSEALRLAAIAVGARLELAEALGAVAVMTDLLPTVHALRVALAPRVTPPEDLS